MGMSHCLSEQRSRQGGNPERGPFGGTQTKQRWERKGEVETQWPHRQEGTPDVSVSCIICGWALWSFHLLNAVFVDMA